MDEQGQLGEFLQVRRSQVQPEQIGLATFGERRRVPGLRREELAQLAGVSTSYYTRLEQGTSLNASAEILDALARALGLDPTETAHLHALAQVPRRRKAVRRGASLLDTLDQIKADLLVGRVSADRLDQLVGMLADMREKSLPGLDAVLDDIELRVRVELAKFGRFPAA